MSALSNEEKNRRIAEACGWTDIREQDYCEAHINPYEGPVLQYWEGVSPNGEKGPLHDYTGDLNAIAEAEKKLDGGLRKDSPMYRYTRALHKVTFGMGHLASAEQRAEAFGLTLGLWKEGE